MTQKKPIAVQTDYGVPNNRATYTVLVQGLGSGLGPAYARRVCSRHVLDVFYICNLGLRYIQFGMLHAYFTFMNTCAEYFEPVAQRPAGHTASGGSAVLVAVRMASRCCCARASIAGLGVYGASLRPCHAARGVAAALSRRAPSAQSARRLIMAGSSSESSASSASARRGSKSARAKQRSSSRWSSRGTLDAATTNSRSSRRKTSRPASPRGSHARGVKMPTTHHSLTEPDEPATTLKPPPPPPPLGVIWAPSTKCENAPQLAQRTEAEAPGGMTIWLPHPAQPIRGSARVAAARVVSTRRRSGSC